MRSVRKACALVILSSLLLLPACKDKTPPVPTTGKAPPGVMRPTTQETPAAEKPDISDLERFPDLGQPVNVTGPDGGLWQKYQSGLMIEELKIGKGRVPEAGQNVWIAYIGTIPETSREFDQVKKDHPLSFRFGTKKVITGWNMTVCSMRPGGRRKVFIPAELAYGKEGDPEKKIGPDQPLIYEIELMSITGEAVKLPEAPAATQPQDRMFGPSAPPTPLTQPGQ